MSTRELLLAVIVEMAPGHTTEGHEYEDAVLALLDRHGGTVERRVRGADEATEVHLIRFGSRAGYESFMTDPDRLRLRARLGDAAPAARVIEAVDVLTHRVATRADLPRLAPLVEAAIAELQREFLDPAQIEASRAIMGIDTQLVDDGTYFVVESRGRIAGCGGWSRRATLFGGDHSAGRDAALLDPAVDPAKVRAMYTHPDFARRGVGRRILALCEAAARAEGFRTLELMATLSGRPLYAAAGFAPVEHLTSEAGGAPVPLVRMRKVLSTPG